LRTRSTTRPSGSKRRSSPCRGWLPAHGATCSTGGNPRSMKASVIARLDDILVLLIFIKKSHPQHKKIKFLNGSGSSSLRICIICPPPRPTRIFTLGASPPMGASCRCLHGLETEKRRPDLRCAPTHFPLRRRPTVATAPGMMVGQQTSVTGCGWVLISPSLPPDREPPSPSDAPPPPSPLTHRRPEGKQRRLRTTTVPRS